MALTQSLQTAVFSVVLITDRFSTLSTGYLSQDSNPLWSTTCIFSPLSRYSLAPCQGHTPAMPMGSTLTHRCLGPCLLWPSAVLLPEVGTASGWLGAAPLSYLTLTSLAAVTHTLLICTHPVYQQYSFTPNSPAVSSHPGSNCPSTWPLLSYTRTEVEYRQSLPTSAQLFALL